MITQNQHTIITGEGDIDGPMFNKHCHQTNSGIVS